MTKVVSFALMLSLVVLGACSSGGEGGTTSPSPAESPTTSPS